METKENKIGKGIARGFSALLNPSLAPTYNVLLLFVYTNFGMFFKGQEFRILFPVIIFTFIIPLSFLAILKELRVVEDYELTNRYDRTFPFLVGILGNAGLFYFFYSAHLQLWFLSLLGSSIVLLVVLLLINFFWKMSAHLTAMGGIIGGVFGVSFHIYKTNPFLLFCLLFILAGCLGVARLYLKRNTPAQLYVGFVLGVCLSYISIWKGPELIYYFMN